ncbi:MAG: sulfite exporter TauE/SafE family protein [Candidatus Hodarchaeales archaeon]
MFEYWFVFFVAVAIATIAMTLGIGGALLFSPFFIIGFPLLGFDALSPADAFGLALLTEVFGFTSGLAGYSRRKLIDYRTAIVLLAITIPAAIIGTMIKRQFEDPEILNFLFGIGLWLLAAYVVLNTRQSQKGPPVPDADSPKRIIIDKENNRYEYLVCNENQGRALIGLGGFVTGLISVGVGETVVSTLRIRCGLPMRVATGTSVLVVTVTVLSAALTDIALIGVDSVPWEIALFTIPGVLIGGQIGPKIATRVTSEAAEKLLIGVFLSIGTIMLLKAILTIL